MNSAGIKEMMRKRDGEERGSLTCLFGKILNCEIESYEFHIKTYIIQIVGFKKNEENERFWLIVLWNYEERSTFPCVSSCVRLNSHFCLSWLLYLLCCVWPRCPICPPSGLKGDGEGCIWAAPHRWWSLRWCISSDLSYCQITAAGSDLRTLKDLHKCLSVVITDYFEINRTSPRDWKLVTNCSNLKKTVWLEN